MKRLISFKVELESLVYTDGVFDDQYDQLPGLRFARVFDENRLENQFDEEEIQRLGRKLMQSCRKLCLMWYSGNKGIEEEQNFYSSTIRDSPALFGGEAIAVYYNLEAFVLLARSSLDIASSLFGQLLPYPFLRGRYDSFNDLTKAIIKNADKNTLAPYLDQFRQENHINWLTIVSGSERGRSLRDQIAHQMEFPLEYMEINPNSEKESAVVLIGDAPIPLPLFIKMVRQGIVDAYLEFEEECTKRFLERVN